MILQHDVAFGGGVEEPLVILEFGVEHHFLPVFGPEVVF